jgi:peptidoglycan hydrolase-like protein with peptidoglycan-binding domain
MTKFGTIIPICIIAVSGCALFDNPEMSTAPLPASAPVVEDQGAVIVPPTQAVDSSKSTPSPARNLTPDDVRRLQKSLRELGFDVGPMDGIAGNKTKKAFSRLQDGCAKLEPLSAKLPITAGDGTGVAPDRIPGREEIVKIQNQLRGAGFDPGPVDGIYGSKTKSMVAQLPDACLMAKEFSGGLDAPSRAVKSESAAPVETAKPAGGRQPTAPRQDAAADVAPAQGAQASEEVRILQLRLRDAGFDPGPFDGVMGAKTKAALAQYEASQVNKKIKTSSTTKKVSGQY